MNIIEKSGQINSTEFNNENGKIVISVDKIENNLIRFEGLTVLTFGELEIIIKKLQYFNQQFR